MQKVSYEIYFYKVFLSTFYKVLINLTVQMYEFCHNHKHFCNKKTFISYIFH